MPQRVTVVKEPLPAELLAPEEPCIIAPEPLNRDLVTAFLDCKAKVENANAKLKAIQEITN